MSGNGLYPRDLIGYGQHPPNPQWPGGAKLALQIALNYEVGAEMNILHGDLQSETLANDTGFPPYLNKRSVLVESNYEYGSRCGIWRLLRILRERQVKCSLFAVGMAIERHPEVAQAALVDGHEIVGHGYRWIDYQAVSPEQEREYIEKTVQAIERITGKRPVGWMTGRPSINTRPLIVEQGGFLYDRDSLSDELPYWTEEGGKSHLCIPYSYETNDKRFNSPGGFITGGDFFTYMKDAFDVLYAEGAAHPKMMSLGLHERTIARPGRVGGLIRFLDYVLEHDDVWIARGDEIARHWISRFPQGHWASSSLPETA